MITMYRMDNDHACSVESKLLGPVVYSMTSANSGLKFNLLFWFMYFCCIVNFKMVKIQVLLTQTTFTEKHVQLHKQAVEKCDLNVQVNQG